MERYPGTALAFSFERTFYRAIILQIPMLNSGHRGLHGHGHFHQGLRCGVHRHRRHGDNPNNLPHLMSQQLILTANERTISSGRPCCETTQVVFFFFFVILRIDSRRVTIRGKGGRILPVPQACSTQLKCIDAFRAFRAVCCFAFRW